MRHDHALWMTTRDLLPRGFRVLADVGSVEEKQKIELTGGHHGKNWAWLLFARNLAWHEGVLGIHKRKQRATGDQHTLWQFYDCECMGR
jgi:hypothetical protein